MRARARLSRALGAALLVLLSGLTTPAHAGEVPLRVMTVSGQAEVFKGGTREWSAAALRAELGPRDAVRTLRGLLTLRSASGQAFRLAVASRLDLLDAGAGDEPTRARLSGGTVWGAVLPGTPPSEQLEIQAGPVSCVVKNGGAGLSLARDNSVLVRVYHGTAECAGSSAGNRWTRVLTDDKEMVVASTGSPSSPRPLVRDKVEADWLKWNEEQDLAGGYGGKLLRR